VATSIDDGRKLTKKLLEKTQIERTRLATISNYVRGSHSPVYTPNGAQNEYKWITDRSSFNMLNLIVSTIAQNLYVDGYRRKEESSDAKAWEIWQANRFDLLQAGIYRSALQFGYAFAVALPGTRNTPDGEEDMPQLRPVSARRMIAAYEDEILDEWPQYAVEISTGFTADGEKFTAYFYDDENIIEYSARDISWNDLKHVDTRKHGTGFCPVVKYRNIIDLDGNNWGEVQPLLNVQDQINFTTYGLLMAQLYSAFRQRWATGLDRTTDENGSPMQPFRPMIDAIIASESTDTKFGEFAATDLNGYLKSREEGMRGMAIMSQLPPYQLIGTGDLASAEALAAARDGLDRLVNERQQSFGESHEQLLRLASKQNGDTTGWNDQSAQVVWRDTSTRAFAATVDALTKLASGLGIPVKALWEKIPGVTKKDVERWSEIAEKEPDALDLILRDMTMPRSRNGAGDAAVSGGSQPASR